MLYKNPQCDCCEGHATYLRGHGYNVTVVPTHDLDEITHQLRDLHAALQARAHELRDADDWQRWANVTVQETLIRRVEALRDSDNSAEAVRLLRAAQEEWKKVSAVPSSEACTC